MLHASNTTDPAATMLPIPIVQPGIIYAPFPIKQSGPIEQGDLSGDRNGGNLDPKTG